MEQTKTKISLTDYEVIIRSIYSPPDLGNCHNIGQILKIISQQRKMMPRFFSSLDRRREDQVRHDSLVVLLKVGLEEMFEVTEILEQPEIPRKGNLVPDIVCINPKIPITFDNLIFYPRGYGKHRRNNSTNPDDPTIIEVKTGKDTFIERKFVPQLLRYEHRINRPCNKLLYYHPINEDPKILLVC